VPPAASYTFSDVAAPHAISATFKPMIAVTSPNGGETWRRGQSYAVRWTFGGAPGTAVKIELLRGTTVNRLLSASAPIGANGAGSFTWKIPGNQATGSTFRVRVTSTSDASATDASDATFTIR